MKHQYLPLLSLFIMLSFTQCEKESTVGHLKVTVTYPEAVYENSTISFIPAPGVGAEVRLYDKDAQCLGIRDARIDVAWIGDDATFSIFAQDTKENEEVLFAEIPAGEYYLIVFSSQLTKYTEKYIEVNGGDTLELTKDFTPDLAFFNDLEPWDHKVPDY